MQASASRSHPHPFRPAHQQVVQFNTVRHRTNLRAANGVTPARVRSRLWRRVSVSDRPDDYATLSSPFRGSEPPPTNLL